MKNYFEINNQELAQDCFLAWLFELFDSENQKLQEAFSALIKCFETKICETGKLLRTKVLRQYSPKGSTFRFDLVCLIELEKEAWLMLVEDKVKAPLKNNLEKYKAAFESDTSLLETFGLNLSKKIHYCYELFISGRYAYSEEKEKAKTAGFNCIEFADLKRALAPYRNAHYLIEDFLISRERGFVCGTASLARRFDLFMKSFFTITNPPKGLIPKSRKTKTSCLSIEGHPDCSLQVVFDDFEYGHASVSIWVPLSRRHLLEKVDGVEGISKPRKSNSYYYAKKGFNCSEKTEIEIAKRIETEASSLASKFRLDVLFRRK